MEQLYFIYTHSIDDIIFYVGYSKIRKAKEGCWSHGVKYERAYSICNRYPAWKSYVAGRNIYVSIVEHFQTKKEAMDAERMLIQKLGTISSGTGFLVNINENLPVYQFDLHGKLIKKHLSVTLASKETGINPASIRSQSLNYGIRSSAGGFQWSYKDLCESYYKNKTVVVKKTLDGGIVAKYPTIEAAAKELGIRSTTSIRCVISGKQNKAYGHKWERVPY